MFWLGAPLSRVERLSLTSFVAHGHPVHLYSYGDVEGVPPGVTRMEAAQILPQDRIFRHERTGSVALFADWFRYRLLYERGGIWADADIVCLRPLDYRTPLVFGLQRPGHVANCVLGLPAGHEVAKWMADSCERPNRVLPYDDWGTRLRKWQRRTLLGDRRERIRWGEYGPKGLTRALRHFGLTDQALPPWHFNPVSFPQWRRLFSAGGDAVLQHPETRAVHLYNNAFREWPGFDKNSRFPEDSPFEILCRKYLPDGA